MSELPTWYPGAEAKPAPMPLLRVQGFVNTRDVEDGTDLLSDPSVARGWLVDAGFLGEDAPEPTGSGLELARQVREAVRSLIELEGAGAGQRDGGDEDPTGPGLEPLRRLAATQRARLTVADDGVIGLESCGHRTLEDGLFELLLIIRRAQADGSWSRMKICANAECQWAFFDRSRNQQGSWCDMAVCGNRLKNRELRARRR